MNDNSAADSLPTFQLVGEGASKNVAPLLAALGIAMTVAATWLFDLPQTPLQPVDIAAKPPAISAVSQPTGIAPPDNQTLQDDQAVVNAVAASGRSAAPRAKPVCPGLVSIYFPVGKFMPEDNGVPSELDGLIEWVGKQPGAKLAVEGHADALGVDESNLLLSYNRAKAVASLLSARGISSQQVQIAAAGSHSPIEGIPGDAWANRRVTVSINDPDRCQSTAR